MEKGTPSALDPQSQLKILPPFTGAETSEESWIGGV